MGDKKDLVNQEAIDKINELAKGNICLFCTYDGNEIVSRPMDTQDVDADGSMWFMSRKDSIKNMQIGQNNKVYLMYLDTPKQHYLSLSGAAEIVYDRQKIEELWTPSTKAWFTEGKDDPEISLLMVTPESGHYWDTKNGSLVSLLKIAAAVITGKEMDGSIQGDIELK
ncbi:MAG: pyridoxamine 5'-phosphate oxidase family protein [Chitinophagaceae bacterium]